MTWQLLRDRFGIPHLRADSVAELAFAQGHTAAVDRAWQLDIERLRGEGRVAALLGASAVEWDRLSRRARIEETARRAFANLRPETREFVQAHVDGVNAGLAPSPEHRALAAAPGRWQPWTPLAVFLAQHLLFATYPTKLWRQLVHTTLGDQGLELFRREGMPSSGSNAFAVGGDRTASGLPLVGGDPHRLFEAPNVYLQVHLACPEFDVVGFAFAGVPGVQHFVHAGSVAWGITNAMADYQDLYVEELDGTESRHVEEIEVRDGPTETVEVVVTPRGPVIIDGDETFSLRTASFALQDLGFDAFLPLLRARTVADVDAAFEHWVEPVNNVVVADSTGAVLHRVAGRVPLRSRDNWVRPAPAENAWQGWVELPRTSVPEDGIVVTANNRISPAFHAIGDDFSPPYRADRIAGLLGDRTGLAVDDIAAILTDTYSARAGGFVDGDYIARRDALVSRLAQDFAPLSGGSPYGRLYDPWFHLRLRLAQSLPAEDPRLDDELPADGTWPHTFHPLHWLEQFGLSLPLVDELHAATSVPVLGDADCVQAMHAVPGSSLCVRGPVARYVWDLNDRDNSGWVVPLGASGAPGPHQHDQLDLWATGRLAPVITDWDRLAE